MKYEQKMQQFSGVVDWWFPSILFSAYCDYNDQEAKPIF